jgi:hypothetical protein
LIQPGSLFATAKIESDIAANFAQPPPSARPWVFWTWINGNVTREGITADLEAMKRVGIGGFQLYNIAMGVPAGPYNFMSPEWLGMVRFATSEAQRLGLEMDCCYDGGWGGYGGGPWITPELSMQKVVFSEKEITGPQVVSEKLPSPERVRDYYKDICVLAFPKVGAYRIKNLNIKALSTRAIPMAPPPDTNVVSADNIIGKDKIVDLTRNLKDDGTLAWSVPAGTWTIVRIGHTSTGATNLPSPTAGVGLECDKLSTTAVDVHFKSMISTLLAAVGPAYSGTGKAWNILHMDSWEAGTQNWTPLMREEFERLRGYDPLPYLPVLTGRVVDSLEISERFLRDLRATVSDLMIDKLVGHTHDLANKNGLRFSIEHYGGNPCDDLTYGGRADINQTEFWFGRNDDAPSPAWAAHIYGKKLVAAEAFTGDEKEKWLGYPGSLKAQGDLEFCLGVNRFLFHRFAMQPWTSPERAPGMSMGPYGVHYERTETWWEYSRPWHEYLARCQYLLQQGLYVADILRLNSEEPQAGKRTGYGDYNYDACSPEVLLTRVNVQDGRLVLPNGMSYKVLVLPEDRWMTPVLLQKISDLVKAGATVIGPRPTRSPSLTNYPKCDEEVSRIAGELWGADTTTPVGERAIGKGLVIWGKTPEEVLKQKNVTPDFSCKLSNASLPDTTSALAARVSFDQKSATVPLSPASAVIDLSRLGAVGDFTITAWVQLPTITNDMLPLVNADGSDLMLRKASLSEGGGFEFFVRQDGELEPRVSSGNKVSPGRWYHLAGVREGKIIKLYVDGVKVAETSRDAKPLDLKKIHLGTEGMQFGEVRFYQRALTNDDVASVANALLPSPAAIGRGGLRSIHRQIGGIDAYFVANTASEPESDYCSFRTQGKRPEFWHPEDGQMEPVPYFAENNGVTTIPMRMAGANSVFVVFVPQAGISIQSMTCDAHKLIDSTWGELNSSACLPNDKKTKTVSLTAPRAGNYRIQLSNGTIIKRSVADNPATLEISGPWEVAFPPNLGAPGKITMDHLVSLSECAEPGVKYFSGTASYSKIIKIPATHLRADRRVILDLGEVAVVADVTLNGKHLGIVWKRPYQIDVTGIASAGENKLEIKVADLWINRMIGDEYLPDDVEHPNDDPILKQGLKFLPPEGTVKEWPKWFTKNKPSPTGRITFSAWRLWKKGDPLQPSGLIGPVVLRSLEQIEIPLAENKKS